MDLKVMVHPARRVHVGLRNDPGTTWVTFPLKHYLWTASDEWGRRMTARKNASIRWTSLLHRAMQNEIGQQLRSEFDAPQDTPTELARPLAQLDKSLVAQAAAPPEVRSPSYQGENRRRRLLLRAMACENAAGKALNEGIREIYLDLAAQWRDLAGQEELLSVCGVKDK
jgi:hypothetical protein